MRVLSNLRIEVIEKMQKLGPCTLLDLALATGNPQTQIKNIVYKMKKSGLVQVCGKKQQFISARNCVRDLYKLDAEKLEKLKTELENKKLKVKAQTNSRRRRGASSQANYLRDLKLNLTNHYYHPLIRTNPSPLVWPAEMTRLHLVFS